MDFDENTRKLTSDTGYIHSLDDELYTDHPIYLGKFDSPDNYEQGSEDGYDEWVKRQEEHSEE